MDNEVIEVSAEPEEAQIVRAPATQLAQPATSNTPSLPVDPYIGVAAMPFDDRAQAVLAKYQTVPDDWIDIKPNGQIYLSHMRLRAIYNEAFGFGGWGMVPVGNFHVERVPQASRYPNKPDYEHVTVYREYRLYVQGRFVRQMMGAGDYYTNNAETNYADAVEASESYALNRSGKPFSIAAQCWDKGYVEWWKATYAVQSEGKWKKRLGGKPTQKPQFTGAESASGRNPQPVTARPPDNPTPPTSEAARPSRSAPAGAPVPGNDGSRVVTIQRCFERKKNARSIEGEFMAANADDGLRYQFHGFTAMEYAQVSERDNRPIRIWIESERKSGGTVYRNVERAEWADAKPDHDAEDDAAHERAYWTEKD